MKPLRVIYLATADARGHLMRAQLLTHALRDAGASVRVVTTSDDGVAFLAEFGIDSTLLSRHYAVQFDTRQNMLRAATDANVARYLFDPRRMLSDIARLRGLLRDADLVVNDSFHPALLAMGCLPPWRRKVVHVYGASLRHALESNFQGRVPAWLARLFKRGVALQIDRSRARLEHGFSYPQPAAREGPLYRLPTPVVVVPQVPRPDAESARQAAVYLNPHFTDPALADALEEGLEVAGLHAHRVGEGYAQRAGWVAHDVDWVMRAVASDVIVSAPGMAALSIAMVYRRPIVLVLTEQPEQQINARRATEIGLPHRCVTWHGDPAAFSTDIDAACRALLSIERPDPRVDTGHADATSRLQSWVTVLTSLVPA